MAEGEDRPRSGFGGAMTGALAAAAIVAAGLLWWAMQSPDPAVPPEPQLAATPAPAPAAAPAPASAPAQPAAPVPQPAAAAPADVVRFDLLRAAPDGSVTVAGAVAPGAQVEVLLDGQVADVLTAGADGRFASVLIGAPTAAPRELKVRVTGADGAAALSAQSLTVAPDPEAVTKAAAAAGAAPETVADQVAVHAGSGVEALTDRQRADPLDDDVALLTGVLGDPAQRLDDRLGHDGGAGGLVTAQRQRAEGL